jgi:hypothetical protein
MNAREVRGDVSGYEGRERWRKGSVMWDTVDLGRRKVGAGSVMKVALGRRVARRPLANGTSEPLPV